MLRAGLYAKIHPKDGILKIVVRNDRGFPPRLVGVRPTMTPHALRAHRPWFGTHEPLQTIGLPPLLKKRSPIAEDKCPLAGGNTSNSALHDPLRPRSKRATVVRFPTNKAFFGGGPLEGG